MQKQNEVLLTGTFKTEQVSPTFSKQVLVFPSKNRDGVWQDGSFELYVKQDLMATSGVQEGDLIKVKGFLVFSFFTKTDGTMMSFPKMIVTEIVEIEKAGAQQAAQPQTVQPTQPQAMMNTGVPVQPPQPGVAPMAPPQPQGMPQQADVFPPVPPQPAQPAA